MTDATRIALAEPRGKRMAGPVERQRCQRHPTRWEMFRWTWPIDAGPESGDVEIVRSCEACADEED